MAEKYDELDRMIEDGDLMMAIGWLVTESALFEEELRFTLYDLGASETVWILLDGQSWEWCAESIRAILAILDERPNPSLLAADRVALLGLLNRSQPLREARNWVVHGTWSRTCLDPDVCIPSASAPLADAPMYHFQRSRFRRGFGDRQFSAADIQNLAESINAISAELFDIRTRIEGGMVHRRDDAPGEGGPGGVAVGAGSAAAERLQGVGHQQPGQERPVGQLHNGVVVGQG